MKRDAAEKVESSSFFKIWFMVDFKDLQAYAGTLSIETGKGIMTLL